MIARRVLVLALAGMTAGCGFHPVYGEGQPGKAALAAVFVNIIPNRSGQLLRQALQERFGNDSGTWSLRSADNPAVQLAGGSVRSVDGYNIIDEQFFYQDLEEDAAEHRLAQALADQIVLAMGVYFDKHPG